MSAQTIGLAGRRISVLALLTVTMMFAPHARAADEEAPSRPSSMFAKGTWTSQFHAAYFHSIVDDEEIVNGVASLGYYFDHRHVFRVELLGYEFDEEGPSPDADDSIGAGINVGLRYHFIEYQRFSLFIDGIAGMQYSCRNFPQGGTHFNFNEQLGLGVTYRVDDNAHLIAGTRFIHISNARIRGEDENPSFDGFGGYVGVMFTF